jgi:hypothetical protein
MPTRCFCRLFDDDRNIIIIDILVVRGCCVGEDLPKISGLKKMSVNQVMCTPVFLFFVV